LQQFEYPHVASHRDLEPPVMTATTSPTQRIGRRTELARYTIPAGQRILYGQRVDGVVRITDNPAYGRGRAYLVERGLEQDGNSALNALVADYLAQPSGYRRSRWPAPQSNVPSARHSERTDDPQRPHPGAPS
jgi:hypothetical protein